MQSSKNNTALFIVVTFLTTLFSSCQNMQTLFTTGTGLGFFIVLAAFVVIVFFLYKFKKYKKP
jgi:hypothetical protein